MTGPEICRSLNNDDIALFGKYMIASHESLRDLYEVTGVELDTLVEEALKVDGCAGSRMTGAGFGGCTVSIVREDAVGRFIDEVGNGYTARTGLAPSFYISEVRRWRQGIEVKCAERQEV